MTKERLLHARVGRIEQLFGKIRNVTKIESCFGWTSAGNTTVQSTGFCKYCILLQCSRLSILYKIQYNITKYRLNDFICKMLIIIY